MILILTLMIAILVYFAIGNRQSCNCESNAIEIKICKKCGQEILDDYNYCPFCKEQLKKKCDSCGKMIDASWRRCPYCE